MTDIPVPKFKIGQTVWNVHHDTKEERFPCPDCLGSREWKVTTPAGTELTTNCLRCSSNYSRLHHVQPLAYRVQTHWARALTIGSVRIDTADTYSRDKVSYMCWETGIGSGNIWYESDLFESEEAAKAKATADDMAANAEAAATPERLELKRVADIRLNGALYDDHHKAVWSAWYAYQRLREDIEELLENKSPEVSAEELAEKLHAEKTYRTPPDLELLLAAIQSAVETDSIEGLRPLLDGLPDLRAIVAEKKLSEIA